MILLALFAIIVCIVLGLSFYDDHNMGKIEQYYKQNNCKAVTYYRGKYQGLCDGKIVVYKNSFSLDMENPTISIELNNVADVKDIITSQTANSNAKSNISVRLKNNQTFIFEFEDINKLKQFKGAMNR